MSALFKGRTFSSATIEKMKAAARARPKRGRTLIEKTCARCSKLYFVAPYRASSSKFCSRKCTKIDKRCEACNAPILKRPGRRRFCSRKCSCKALIGPLHPSFKHGKSRSNPRAGRRAAKLRAWSRLVMERDGFRCQTCGSNRRLHAHHLKAFADFPRLRYVVENGKTLCEDCHSAVHGKPLGYRKGRSCVDCGTKCTGKRRHEEPRCRSCAVKRWHALGRPRAADDTSSFKQMSLPL